MEQIKRENLVSNFGITEENLHDPEIAAIATIIKLSQDYKVYIQRSDIRQKNGITYENQWERLAYAHKYPSRLVSGVDNRNNQYVKNVNKVESINLAII